MQFRNRSSILSACLACIATAGNFIGQATGLIKAPAAPGPSKGRTHHSRPRKPTRRQRIKAAFKRRRQDLGYRMTMNRLMWLRSVYDGSVEKARMIAQQKGKHGPWMLDGRMEKRRGLKAL